MDYKELLIKYIKHVEQMEGYTFIDDINCTMSGILFDEAEVKELNEIDNNLRKC